MGLVMGLLCFFALTAGCQQQQETAPPTQAGLLAAANVELQVERADHEAEIEALRQQYGDVLHRREDELARLQKEIATLSAENDELRDKIRLVKIELAKLAEMMGTEPPKNGG